MEEEIQQIIITEDGEEMSAEDESQEPEDQSFEYEVPDSLFESLKTMNKPVVQNSTNKITFGTLSPAKALLDGKFFRVVKEFYSENKSRRKVRKIRGQCCLCTTPSYITCSYDSTSNFIRHLKRKHGKSVYESYLSYKKSRSRVLSSAAPGLHTVSVPQLVFKGPNKQLIPIQGVNMEPPKVQRVVERFQGKLLKFMINCMQPLSLLDDPNFSGLFPEIFTPVVNSANVITQIQESFDSCQERIKKMLTEVKYFTVTIDAWTVKFSSFVAFTCHWINDEFVRKCVLLSCNQLTDTSVNHIISLMNDTFQFYDLKIENIVGVITHNGIDCQSYFKDLKIVCKPIQECRFFQNSFDKSVDASDSTYFEFLDLNIQREFDKTSMNINCSLSTIALSSLISFLQHSCKFSNLHEKTILKCNKLWNLPPNMRERLSQILGWTFSVPRVTSWISYYQPLKALISGRNNLVEVCSELDIEEFSSKELEYIDNYIKIMNPFASALDTLKEENVYFAYVLPTLMTVKMKLENMKNSDEFSCPQLVETLLTSFCRTFKSYLSLDLKNICVRYAILAAVSHPKLKLRWIADAEKVAKVKQLLIDECSALNVERELKIEDIEDDDFFADCLKADDDIVLKNEMKSSSELETVRFLASKDKSMEMINSYPNVKLVFLKYNSLLTNPVAVDKLLNFEKLIHTELIANNSELQMYLFLKGNMNLIE